MRQTELHLSEEDRTVIDDIRSKGVHRAREVNRAHVLSSLDRGIAEAQITAVLGIGRVALWRTRAAYLQGGVQLAVFDLARPGRPRRYDTAAEARVTALACSAPPEARRRWTTGELQRVARCEPALGTVSRETVRRMLKKTRVASLTGKPIALIRPGSAADRAESACAGRAHRAFAQAACATRPSPFCVFQPIVDGCFSRSWTAFQTNMDAVSG